MKKTILLSAIFCLLCLHVPQAPGVEQKIGALGRISPAGGIISVNPAAGNLIVAVPVSVGQMVRPGENIVSFRIPAPSASDVELAELDLKEAEVTTIKAIEIKRREVRIAEMELENSMKNLQRLLKGGPDTYSSQQKETNEHLSRVAKAKLDLAHQELERLEKDREFKVSRAERKLRSMKDQAERYMVAPVEGTVIETLQNPGEVSSGGPVIKLADLRRMNVLAEVFEGEITRVKPGMQAVITAKVFSEPLNGKVVSVGRIISPQSRNVQVAISLDNPEIASGYINLEVNVSILP